MMPGFTWRWGLKSAYDIEQVTFAMNLIRRLRREPVDIVHTQDVGLARNLVQAQRRGRIQARTILAHGTSETWDTLAGFPFIQHLAPCYYDEAVHRLPGAAHFMIPNPVDTRLFTPVEPEARQRIRGRWGIPPGALVVGFSGALKRDHKQVHRLIETVAAACAARPELFLLAAGAATPDTAGLLRLAAERLPRAHAIHCNLPFDAMPDLYRAMDVYLHSAVEEFFGICILEAMACGVPVLAHASPVLGWIVGEGGWSIDGSGVPNAQALLENLEPREIVRRGRDARMRVHACFDVSCVLEAVVRMCDTVWRCE